jgi:lipopolysaccharide export system permease protein
VLRTRRISFYIAREILVPFSLGLVVFTFFLLIGRTFKLSELIINKGVSLLDILRLLIYILPNFLIFTIPMALLLGVLLAFGRLSSDQELTAMKASGISLFQLIPPVVVVSFLCYLLALFMAVYALPWGSNGLRNALYDVARKRAYFEFKPRVFNDTFNGLVFYVDRIDSQGNRMEGVLIQDERNKEKPQVIVSEAAQLVPDLESEALILMLGKGSIHTSDQEDRSYRKVDFDHYYVKLGIGEFLGGQVRTVDSERSIGELRREIRRRQSTGEDCGREKIALNEKFSFPFASVVFGLLGISLGIGPPRSGRSYGLVMGLAIIMGYYVLITAAERLVTARILSPLVAAWIPNIVFLAMGTYFILLKGFQRRPLIVEWLSRLMDARVARHLRNRSYPESI